MVKDLLVSASERDLVAAALVQNPPVRVDRRATTALRPVQITYGPDFGYAQVSLGKTRCAATVSATVTAPRADHPSDGILLFNTEIAPMAQPGLGSSDTSRVSEDEVFVSRMLDKALRLSRAVDTEGLCILAGQQVWTVRVDVRVLDNDGNIMDCASLAAVAALLHFRRPDVSVAGEDVTIHPADEKSPVPLTVYHAPLCTSFAFFDQGRVTLLDPTRLEEALQDGHLTVATNVHRELCAMAHAGGAPLAPDQVLLCAQLAASKVHDLTRAIHTALKADYDARGISLHASNIFDKIQEDGGDVVMMGM
ncbi:Exosome complex component RRP45 [Allomyces arbusculus]|nr:Exosome complex component RRP45 [Allomyces arbusculus]